MEQTSSGPEKVSRKVSVADNVGKLKEWKIPDLSKLSINVNPKEKNVLIKYGKQSSRLSFSEFNQLFSPYALSLIVEHYKSCCQNEPPIVYDGRNIAYNVKASCMRRNHLIVSDFNFRIRKLFSLPKNEKAFAWSADRDHKNKSLKARVEIKVHF